MTTITTTTMTTTERDGEQVSHNESVDAGHDRAAKHEAGGGAAASDETGGDETARSAGRRATTRAWPTSWSATS